jgi:hypothetical protein
MTLLYIFAYTYTYNNFNNAMLSSIPKSNALLKIV